MWFVFIVSCIVIALAALLIIWIGSKIFHSIEKQDKKAEIDNEINEQIKKEIRKQMEDK